MRAHLFGPLIVILAVCGIACRGDSSTPPIPTSTAAVASATPEAAAAIATATATAIPTPQTVKQEIRATRLTIPSLNIDSDVKPSQTVPDTSVPLPGCPARPAGDTLTVPNQGIATPDTSIEGLENKDWIFGHSRWQNTPGIFFSLQDISLGDELFVDGIDRATGERVTHKRFVVNGIYLTDIDSGDKLITAQKPADIPQKAIAILQTSVREEGAGKQWLLDQQKVLAKSRNLVQGDVNDPCKYLLLFVFAESA